MTNFSELPISAALLDRLSAAQFSFPTAIQTATIPPAREGKDVLATAQTGTGKTLAFLLPVMERLLECKNGGVAALILTPTRELAMQIAAQYEQLRTPKMRAAALLVGGLSERPQLEALRQGANLVVACPGRLEDLMQRRLIRLGEVQVLVLDEADRMLDIGFLPSVRRVIAALPRQRQTMCFSATLAPQVAQLARETMTDPVRLALGSATQPVSSVKLQAFEVIEGEKPALLQHLLAQHAGRCLVFARTKRGTERVAKTLIRDGHAAAMIHGDRSQAQRSAALHGFQRGSYQVLVATDVAARGIHVQDVEHVINYDFPETQDDFVHRVGRTGRAGEAGLASTFVSRAQMNELKQMERLLGVRLERMPRVVLTIKAPAPEPRPAAPARVSAASKASHRPVKPGRRRHAV
ncbi:MAG: DEAD/DEAH box helicase [Terriglobales bacterium]